MIGLTMGIPSKYGGSYGTTNRDRQIIVWKDRYVDGVFVGRVYSDTITKQVYLEVRGPKTKNRRLPIAGTSTLWISPAPYFRGISQQSWGEVFWVTTTGVKSPIIVDYDQTANWNTNSRDAISPFGAIDWNKPGGRWAESLENESVTKAIARFKSRSVGLGEDLATAKQTYTMLAESGMSLLKAVLAVKRGNIKGAINALGDGRSVVRRGADLLLQYKYGWKPLMSDIYGLHGLLTEQLKPAHIVSASAKSQAEHITPWGQYDSSMVTGAGERQTYTKLYGKMSGKYLAIMEQVGLANPLSLAWELVPWSFVSDWFLPIGPALDSMTSPAGVDFLGGFTTQKSACNLQVVRMPGPTTRGDPCVNTHQCSSMERKIYTNWPKGGLYNVKPFSWGHGESAFALMLQKLFK